MPITIECTSCHSTFNVGDALAGKRVKCRKCGDPILVPGFEAPSGGGPECLSCGRAMPRGAAVCPACGYNAATGQKEAVLLVGEEEAAKKRKRRWERAPGNATLEMLDQLVKLVLLLVLVAGVGMSVYHFIMVPGGFDVMDVVPLAMLLALIVVVMAPIVMWGIKFTVRKIKYAPRDDTYSRVVLCLLLPPAAAMLAGWPEQAGWAGVVRVAWLAAVLLLIYFFRADMIEWVASIIAATLAILLGVLAISFAGSGITRLTGPLYGDMMPAGPWSGLATGHSPPPQIEAPKPVAGSQPAETAPTVQVASSSPAAGAGAATSAASTTVAAVATEPAKPTKLTSVGLANIAPDDRFAGVRDIIVASVPADHFLAVRDSDTTTTVERWSIQPLKKSDEATYPLFARKPPQFALSPKGDEMVALQFFPRNQIEVTTFDGKTPPKSIAPSEAQATPTLLGFLDENNFGLRWDLNGQTVIEIQSVKGQQVRHFNIDAINPEAAASVISPNGKLLAAFGRGQILLNPLDTNQPARHIQASDLPVRLFALAFSPDSAQISMYAAIDSLPTLLTFKIATGDLVSTRLLSQVALPADYAAIPHALIWLPNSQTWLIDGKEFFDAASGKKLADISGPPILDVALVGEENLAFTLRMDDQPAVTFAKPDETQLRKRR